MLGFSIVVELVELFVVFWNKYSILCQYLVGVIWFFLIVVVCDMDSEVFLEQYMVFDIFYRIYVQVIGIEFKGGYLC